MLTFENVLEIFHEYLLHDPEEEVLPCKRGYVRLTWNKDSRYCVDGILCRPRRNCLTFCSRITRTLNWLCRPKAAGRLLRPMKKPWKNCASPTWTGGRRR